MLQDPQFEQVPATRLHRRAFGRKTHRKAVPPGVSDHDGKILTKVKCRAHKLDTSLFSCFGIRFGWSSVIGIIPGVGDAIDAFMAFMVLRTCCQIEGGLPMDVQLKMWINILLDFVVGLSPFVGDIIDALFCANTRNAVELEKFLRKRGAARLKGFGQTIPVIDPSDSTEYDRFHDEQGKP
ncbi:putative membrane protein [Lachnellula arida]|uniref:Putative membrane protein n=1 Tax=Lachnellula arida TaxID=1316785 RepID=A0A8T9B6F1_9HELO|nr:putative membrane protein [Lachnellula arida]